MSESAGTASIVPVKKQAPAKKRSPRKSKRGRFSRSARANYRILGVKPGASRKTIERAFKLLARKNHPDCGGDPAVMRAITAAYESVRDALPKPGRPPKYPQYRCGFAIVDDLRDNEVVLEGFETREAAEEELRALRERLRTEKSQAVSHDLNGRRSHFVVVSFVGSSGAERVKAHRERAKQKAAEEARLCEEQKTPEYWNRLLAQSGLSVNRGLYLTDAPAGMGRLITGGWTATKIETVTAAHEASLGGPGAQTRRSRGGGFRCFGMIGNGPDQFEKYDPTEDSADTYSETRLSSPAGDFDRECWANDDDGNPWIAGDEVDALLGPSVEDQRLPKVPDWSRRSAMNDSEDVSEVRVEDISLAGTNEFSEFPDFSEDEYNEVLDVFEDPSYAPLPMPSETPAQEGSSKPAPVCNEIPHQFDVVPSSKLLTGNNLAAL